MNDSERGFTLVELLVTLGLLSMISVGFYSVLFAGSRTSDVTQTIADLSQEARLGFNRLVRDTREATVLEGISTTLPSSTGYNVLVEFDGVAGFTNPPDNAAGYYEDLEFEYNSVARTITLNDEVLIEGVEPVAGQPVFGYQSNRLEYDANGDGVTTLQELVDDGTLTESEIRSYISSVVYAVRIRSGDRTSDFFAEAQLRNRR